MSSRNRNRRRKRRGGVATQFVASASEPSGASGEANESVAARPPRKRRFAFVAGAAVVLLLVVLLPSLPGTSSGSLTASAHPDHGKALYRQYCVSCHGVDGRGERNWMYREHGAPALDDSGHAWHHEDAQLVSMILDKPIPDSRMPAWRGILSRGDAIDVVAYIKSLWSPYILANCQGAKHMQCMARQ